MNFIFLGHEVGDDVEVGTAGGQNIVPPLKKVLVTRIMLMTMILLVPYNNDSRRMEGVSKTLSLFISSATHGKD